MQKAK